MAQQKDVVFLVDGSSYIHRAYHAIRNLSNSRGLPTSAIFGFSRMILKLMEEEKPVYMAVVLDAKGPTFRHRMYKDYKATRPPMPEDLQVQIPYIREILDALNVKVLEKEGYEADDVIATLAKRAEEKGFRVVVVTGDKDFRQIVSPRVSLLDTMKGSRLDYDTLTKEYGLNPEQMIDVMGLAGDAVDNVPGVKGIGEKTALALVREFGSLEEVFHRLEEVKKERLREALQKGKEDALLSKKLVTVDFHVPLDEKVDDLEVGNPDGPRLAEIFRDLEFRDLRDQFFQKVKPGRRDDRLVLTEQEIRELAKRVKEKGVVALAVEPASGDPLRSDPAGIGLAVEEERGYYIPLAHAYPGAPEQIPAKSVFSALADAMEDESVFKVSQNAKHGGLVLKRHGIDVKGLHFDTAVASYVINPGLRQHDLRSLAQVYLNHNMMTSQELLEKTSRRFGDVDVMRAMDYACEEATVSLRLRAVMDEALRSEMNQDLFYNLEMKLIPVLMDMEWAGIKVDVPFFEDLSRQYAEQLQRIEKEIFDEAGMAFNINSPQQLGFVLFEKMKLPVQKKTNKTKAYSTDVKVLNKLAALPFKIPKLLLRYRTLSKLKSTYLDALVSMVHPGTGRIHTSFNQTVAATGRLSSSNPNLQNIPARGEEGREIRKGFIAEKGFRLLSADYSQIELRVFAHYSKDPAFIEAFGKEEDIHARTASEMLGVPMDRVNPDMRRLAKAINFGIIYGMGPQKLSDELGIDVALAKDYIAAYLRRYAGVVRYKEETLDSARRNGYVSTLFGRRRYLPDMNHKNRMIRGEAERMAVNTPIQGTAADLIKKAMIRIHDRLEKESFKSRMLLQVHDELVFEAPEDELDRVGLLVKEEMEGVHELAVPLKVDVKSGKNWDEAH